MSDVVPQGGGVVKLTNNSFNNVEKYPIQGYYQCAVFKASYMKEEERSKKVHLQFQGNVFNSKTTTEFLLFNGTVVSCS